MRHVVGFQAIFWLMLAAGCSDEPSAATSAHTAEETRASTSSESAAGNRTAGNSKGSRSSESSGRSSVSGSRSTAESYPTFEPRGPAGNVTEPDAAAKTSSAEASSPVETRAAQNVLHVPTGSSDQAGSGDRSNSGITEDPSEAANAGESSESSRSASAEQAGQSDRAEQAAAHFASLLEAHKNERPSQWQQAEEQLHKLGEAAVPAYTKALQSDDREARELATMMLAGLGRPSGKTAEALQGCLDDESAYIRANAASALSHTDKFSERVIPVLASLLREEDVNLRLIAAISLRHHGARAQPAASALLEALDADEAELRRAAAIALGDIGQADPETRNKLNALSKEDGDADVRQAASQALKRLPEP